MESYEEEQIVEECPICEGSGLDMTDVECLWCHGTGLVPHDCD